MTFARCVIVGAMLVACEKGKAPPAATKVGTEGLAELFAHARDACAAKDFAKGSAIVSSIIPTKDQLKKALADDAPAQFVDDVFADYQRQVPAEEAKVACLLSPPGRTEIIVHQATTEEIAAYGESVATEFPEGARRLATLLHPATTFYEVETVEPGKDKGTKFHLFYQDGAQWRMLGPAWRYLPDAHPTP